MTELDSDKHHVGRSVLNKFAWLQLRELHHDKYVLTIKVAAYKDSVSTTYKIVWQQFLSLRTTSQDCSRQYGNEDIGHIRNVSDSPWLADLAKSDEYLDAAEFQHFTVDTDSYFVEVLSKLEPVVTLVHETDLAYHEPTYSLVIPEPKPYYSRHDEDNYFRVLNSLPECERVKGYNNGPHNDLVLSLSQPFLSDPSLRALIGLFQRYQLPMTVLSTQCGEHNEAWFKNPKSYWYAAVFEPTE